MHEITTFRIEEIIFFAVVWAVAFAAAFARAVRDHECSSFSNACALGFTAGILSFGIVTFLIDRNPDRAGSPWYYLGISALIGLLAKEQDKYARLVMSSVFNVMRTLQSSQGKSKETEDRKPE